MNCKKTHFIFVNDHSSSMRSVSSAAVAAYNAVASTVAEEAKSRALNTVVSLVQFGVKETSPVNYPPDTAGRVKQASLLRARDGFGRWDCPKIEYWGANPNVIAPLKEWVANGWTPMYDAIGIAVNVALAEVDTEQTAYVLLVTTDGEDNSSSIFSAHTIKDVLKTVQDKANWTVAFRVPRNAKHLATAIGVAEGNIHVWDTTSAGMAKSAEATRQAVSQYMGSRSAGGAKSHIFYAVANGVDVSGLTEVKHSLYTVPQADNGIEILPFLNRHIMAPKKGAGFYQLTKTEARIGPEKKFLLRSRKDGKMYEGDVRKALGLDAMTNIRLHPGDHGGWDIFIQSSSPNRKLVGGTGLAYVAHYGTEWTEEDKARAGLTKPTPAPTGPVALPPVPVSTKPTPSPAASKAPPAKAGPTVMLGRVLVALQPHASRSAARAAAKLTSFPMVDGEKVSVSRPAGARWFSVTGKLV